MPITHLTTSALFAVVGLVAGSFVNLVAARLPRNEPIDLARSHADCCGAVLSARELAPVVSWLAQRGRCRRCGAGVSVRHPLVELAGAAIGVWAVMGSDSLAAAVLTALFGWQLLLIALIDADELWLPDRLTLPLLGSGIVAAVVLEDRSIVASVIGAGAGFAVLWAAAQAYRLVRARDGLGGGDPILFAGLGAWVGWTGLATVLLWACAAGLSWVGARALLRRPLAADEPMPFGPFLVVGGWLTWIYGAIGPW